MNPMDKPISRREALRRTVAGGIGLVAASTFPRSLAARPGSESVWAGGRVYDASSGDGPDSPGIPGVAVSNGEEVVLTGSRGEWSLPLRNHPHTVFFVIKPRNWRPPLTEVNTPRFYYVHAPEGSPGLDSGGLPKTGPLPERIDFPLIRDQESEDFTCLFLGDPQVRDRREIRYLADDLVSELRRSRAAFSLCLGDIVFDRPDLFGDISKVLGQAGMPMWYLFGNHDIDFGAADDTHAADSYKAHFGPDYYAFNYGPVHFIVLNTVVWGGGPATNDYQGEVSAAQLAFVENDLRTLSPDQPIVLVMHIPLDSGRESPRTLVTNREALLAPLRNRRLLFATSAHTHWNEHNFLGPEHGWEGSEPLHHSVNVTTCGAWWSGGPDELGVPHATMRDGAPRGYTICRFRGDGYTLRYKASRRDSGYQINIVCPESVLRSQLGETVVFANVFGGSERSEVRVRFGNQGDWLPMEMTMEPCPLYVKMREESQSLERPFRRLAQAQPCRHLWKSRLPADLPAGVYAIEVETTDLFGQTDRAVRSLVVTA